MFRASGMEVVAVLLFLFYHLAAAQGGAAPCYECDDFKQPARSTSYNQQDEEVRSHCSYPCECPDETPTCPQGVSLIRDGCGCCAVCARQVDETCDGTALCDERRGLVCQYPSSEAHHGACQVIKGLPCSVDNKTFDNGETFMLDCRTQCSCQNGTYACSSLCPQEALSPDCNHPRLVEVPGQCCREWMCDSVEAQRPPECEHQSSAWSECSALDCGLGVSRRVSNENPRCVPEAEGRLCQVRACEAEDNEVEAGQHGHKIRKGHECKATQKVHRAVRLRVGACWSRKMFWPKFCGECRTSCCEPQLSTTKQVEFLCPVAAAAATQAGLLEQAAAAAGGQLWHRKTQHRRWDDADEEVAEAEAVAAAANGTAVVRLAVQWILKCACSAEPPCPERLHRVHRTAALLP
ncbi:CCN family member 2 [Neocloeon triangulifer]|uniref:CCN family member 2 n=1 Tax=Neocloeon triangulifer TaxID=2078957 RepID=UPI00286EE358|nr:CCN family member 2 [Neocloeon triangulifer]